MSTIMGLNVGATAKRGPAADYSMLLEMKRRSLISAGVPVKTALTGSYNGKVAPVLSDRPMQRGFDEGLPTARLHLRGAVKNFIKF